MHNLIVHSHSMWLLHDRGYGAQNMYNNGCRRYYRFFGRFSS